MYFYVKIVCMKHYLEFRSFYKECISIIKRYQGNFKNLSNTEKIRLIRQNSNKDLLNSYYNIGKITKEIATSINSKTTYLKLSTDSMVKNLLEHPEITIKEYSSIGSYINNAEYILKKNNKNLIYFKIDDKIYQFVIKCTKSGDELFLTTFHKASAKQLAKDICRYIPIKKDSLDCEDSNYPSVT